MTAIRTGKPSRFAPALGNARLPLLGLVALGLTGCATPQAQVGSVGAGSTPSGTTQPGPTQVGLTQVGSAQVEAGRFLAAGRASEIARALLLGMRDTMVAEVVATHPGRRADAEWLVDEILLPELKERVPEWVDIVRVKLGDRLTASELYLMRRLIEMKLSGRSDLPPSQWTPEESAVVDRAATLDRARITKVTEELRASLEEVGEAWGEAVAIDAVRKNEDKIRARGMTWSL